MANDSLLHLLLGAKIAAMAPPGGKDCISRPRFAISRSASSKLRIAGNAGRDILADRMPHHGVRCHTPGAPQLGESILDRKQGGLRVGGLVEKR